MKNKFIFLIIIANSFFFGSCETTEKKGYTVDNQVPPNILLILIDDLGWISIETY
ncbi:hypothetical protein ACFLU5_01800 [Bacteroidota bacterium]